MAPNLNVELVIAGKDMVSGAVNKVNKGLESMTTKAAEMSAKFLLIKNGISEAIGMLDNFIQGAITYDAAITRSLIAMDKEGVSAEQLKNSINDLADATLDGLYSHQQTAAAFQSIADEGHSLADSLGLVEASMNLAAISGGDLTQITGGMEDILSSWGLTAADAGHVSDVLVNTWKRTGAEIDTKLVPALKTLGQTAQAIGMPFEEATAILGVLKDRGVENIQGLMTGFQQMTKDTGEAADMMKAFGVDALDSQGKLKPMVQIFEELTGAGATSQDMFMAFGQRSAASMTAVMNAIGEMGEIAVSNFDATGEAADDAGQYGESAAADYDRMKTSMEDLKTELAAGLLPVLSGLMRIVGPILSLLEKYPAIIYAAVGAFIAYKIAMVASTVATHAKTVANWLHAASQWAVNIAMYANPIVWIIAAIIALIAVIYLLVKNWDKVTAAFKKFGGWIKGGMGKAKDAIVNFAGAARDKLGAAGDWIGDKIKGMFDFHKKAYEWGKNLLKAFFDGIKDMFGSAGDTLRGLGGKIKNFLGFSAPPMEGPLRDVPEWGRHLGETYIGGIREGFKDLKDALPRTPPASTTTNTYYQTIDARAEISAQPIDLTDPIQVLDTWEEMSKYLGRATLGEG